MRRPIALIISRDTLAHIRPLPAAPQVAGRITPNPVNPAPPMSSPEARAEKPARQDPVRLLYPAAALSLLVITLLGFQQFYLHGKAYPAHPLAPPIKALLIAHGIAMTAWIVIFLVQTLLIVGRHRRLHMTIGPIAAVLAAIMVVLGLWLPIQTTRFEPDVTLWGLNRPHFMAIPMISILTFGAFVAVGIWQRRRPEIHRPMMLMATLAITAAAADRITGLPDLYAASIWGGLFGPFFTPLVIGAVFFGARWLLTRSFDRWFAGGYAVLVVISAFIMKLAPTHAWEQFATFLVR